MAITGARNDPMRGFRFIVRLTTPTGDLVRLGARMVSGLRSETEIVEYREGNEISTVRKLPGLTTYDNITIERGQVEGIDHLLDWRKLIVTAEGDGAPDSEIRGYGIIQVFPKGTVPSDSADPVAEYVIREAWPAVFEHADLDATASDVWFERVELAHEGLEFYTF